MKRKFYSFVIFLVFQILILKSIFAQSVKVISINNILVIENEFVSFNFNLSTGYYNALNNKTGLKGLSDASFQVGKISSDNPECTRNWKAIDINNKGKKIIITCERPHDYSIILEVSLFNNSPYIVLCTGIKNTGKSAVQCKNITPFVGRVFEGNTLEYPFYTLDGNGGGEPTEVNSNRLRTCRNNLMATLGTGMRRKTIVLGGLSYHDFEKYITLQKEEDHIQLCLYGYDPIGKKVDAGMEYLPDDKFYIDFITSNPFESLEQYALTLLETQQIKLPIYDFPTVCLWYASTNEYGGGPAINDSKGAIWETMQIAKTGFLKYSHAAVRLVPDNYERNNQQGWWDDKHFQLLPNTGSKEKACYIAPYETSEKWAREVIRLGGIPFIYVQTARRSEDYASEFPEHMLFNQSNYKSESRPVTHEAWWQGTTKPLLWSYDFTDTGFISHIKLVYSNFSKAGIKGMMFDYPQTAWNYEGGFDDPYSTTASAYRQVFKLAAEGLGEGSYIDERNLERGSDITLGVVASQRIWGDIDLLNPMIVSRGGLRWYKNRMVVNYDMDAKNLNHCEPNNKIGMQSMLTMSYVTSGRFLFGLSFSKLTTDQFYALTRIFPFHSQPKSARPIDAFTGKKFPEIYDFEIDSSWHQLTLYNAALNNYDCEKFWYGGHDCELKGKPIASEVRICLGTKQPEGGLGLLADKKYYLYEYWNNKYLGKYNGSDTLKFSMQPAEAKMISVHEAVTFPQFISTNRHIMQGYYDMVSCKWNPKNKSLEGESKVVASETYKVIIATNGNIPRKCSAKNAIITFSIIDKTNNLVELSIISKQCIVIKWRLEFW